MLQPRTLVAAVVAAATIAFAVNLISPQSAGQFTATAQPIGGWWPPHPRDQIQISGEQVIPGVAGGATLTLYTVPLDKWLVIVPGWTQIGTSSGTLGLAYGVVEVGGNGQWVLDELKQAVYTTKHQIPTTGIIPEQPMRMAPPSPQFSMGLRFSPGSLVVIRDLTDNGGHVAYNLHGFLAPL